MAEYEREKLYKEVWDEPVFRLWQNGTAFQMLPFAKSVSQWTSLFRPEDTGQRNALDRK